MRWILVLISIILILSLPVSAAEIGIEPNDGAYLLVFTSSQPSVISAYTVQLDYDPTISVMDVSSVEPFEVFSKIYPDEGVVRISAFAMAPHTPAIRVPLARVMAETGFSPLIHVECLEDFDRNPIQIEGLSSPKPDEGILPEYQADIYLPPGTQVGNVPDEVRLDWKLPVEYHVPGTMPVVYATITPDAIVTTTATGDSEDVLPPLGEVSEGQIPLLESAAEMPDIPVTTTPISLIPIIGGLIIVIFIIRGRV